MTASGTTPDPAPAATSHGWDTYIASLDDTTKGEMGFVDPILINYANFIGDELRAFHLESAQSMARLQKLDDDMAKDYDAVGKLDHSLAFLSTLVTANALSIKQTDSNIKGLASALKEVKETASKAFRMASDDHIKVTTHGVKLNWIEDCLEKHSNIFSTIEMHNATRETRVQSVESGLTAVQGSIDTFDARLDAKLHGQRTNMDMEMTALRTDVTDIWARLIPDLRRDLRWVLIPPLKRLWHDSQTFRRPRFRRTRRLHAPRPLPRQMPLSQRRCPWMRLVTRPTTWMATRPRAMVIAQQTDGSFPISWRRRAYNRHHRP